MSGEFTYAVESPISQEGVARIIRRADQRVVATWRLLPMGECVPEFNIGVQPPVPQNIVDDALRVSISLRLQQDPRPR